jgi:hypothetical protein
MNALEWLEGKVPAFRDLGVEDRRAIMEFALLWGFFEFSLLEASASAEKISQLCESLSTQNKIAAECLVKPMEYWRNRYYADGDFTDHFHSLNFRNNDKEEAVRAVLEQKDASPKAQLLFALLIVWRFRNNLFHGTKWTYTLKDQRTNFELANALLMAAIDMSGARLET